MSEMYETPGIAQMVEKQWKKWLLLTQRKAGQKGKLFPTITISREKASGGSSIAGLLAERLGLVVFDRAIVDEVARSASVDRVVVEHLDERSRHSIRELTERVIHRRNFSPETYMAYLTKTILTIGEKGGAVIIGRGAHLLLPVERCFRVRVVAPFEIRVERLSSRAAMERTAAESLIAETDRERAQFIKEHFQQSDDNPLLYDLVINTGRITLETAVELIARAVEAGFPGVLPAVPSATQVSASIPE